jgi:hypothetical protein
VAGDKVTLELKTGAMCHCTKWISRNKHWDHAYAQTVHASQGATQHRAIFHIRAPQTESEEAGAGAGEHGQGPRGSELLCRGHARLA